MMKSHKNTIIIVLALSTLGVTSVLPTDGYVPAVLYIEKYFHLNDSQMQMTLSVFTSAMGYGQLVFGPLSDYLGRRTTALIAIAIFVISSFLYMCASTYHAFTIFRFLQGLGAAGLSVITVAIIRDLYPADKISILCGYLGAVCALSPILAPIVGGYIATKYGWRSTGYLFLLPSIIGILCIYFIIPESLPKDKRIKFNINIIITYKNILFNKAFLFYTFVSGIGLITPFIFSAISPYILIGLFKMSPRTYALSYSLYGIIFMLGNYMASYVIDKIGTDKCIFYGLLTMFIGGVGMIILNQRMLSVYSFYITIMIAVTGGVFCLVAGMGGAIKPFSSNAGAAVALSNTIRFAIVSIIGMIVINKNIDSTFPVEIALLFASITGLAVYLIHKS